MAGGNGATKTVIFFSKIWRRVTDLLDVLTELNLKQFGGSNCEISRVKKRREKQQLKFSNPNHFSE